ncbi:MAG: hypothetical protein ABI333_20765 [bacterium]
MKKIMTCAVALSLLLGAGFGCSGVDKNDDNNNNANANANENANTNENTNENNNENTNANNNTGGTGTLTGALSTTVTCDATPAESDCSGTVYLVVLAENPLVNPYQDPEASAIMASVDLRGGSSVQYTISDVPVGTWYVSGWLDDDGNTPPLLPSADIGDPVVYPVPQVTITADQTTTQNLGFSMRMPQ